MGDRDEERDSSTSTTRSSDQVEARFEKLHKRLDERLKGQSSDDEDTSTDASTQFLPSDRPKTATRVGDRAESTDPKQGIESVEKLRALFEERLSEPSMPNRLTDSENDPPGNEKLYIGIALGIVLAVLLPGLLLSSAAHVTDTVFAAEPTESLEEGETLYIEPDTAAYLSRIFQETTHEVAYCGLITDDTETPTLEVWMANTLSASPGTIEFITDNCPEAFREANIHTHPGGSLELSETDRRTLEEVPEEIMCVQNGSLATEPGATVENLACYMQQQPDKPGLELVQLPVEVDE